MLKAVALVMLPLVVMSSAVFAQSNQGARNPASTPAYVGTWGVNAAQCRNAQETNKAPMVIRARGYDQFETHCDFTSVARTGRVWKAKTKCSVEGDKQTQTLTLAVSGKTLSYRWGKGPAAKLVRCP